MALLLTCSMAVRCGTDPAAIWNSSGGAAVGAFHPLAEAPAAGSSSAYATESMPKRAGPGAPAWPVRVAASEHRSLVSRA